MKLAVIAAILTAITLFIPPAQAQSGIGATFTVSHIGPDATEPWIFGPTFSFQDERGGRDRDVKGGIDIRFSYLRKNGLGVNSFVFGPRIAFPQKHPRIKPYIEFLIGYLGVENRVGQPLAEYFDVQFVGGIDRKVARHLDWRIIEYTFGLPVDSDRHNRNQFGTGLIARF